MILRVIWAFLLLQIVPSEGSTDDEGPFKVYRVVPTTSKQLMQMIQLFETANGNDADFWHAPSTINGTVDIMVSPSYTESFHRFLVSNDYPYHIAIHDLKQMLIEKEGSLKTHENDVDDHQFEGRMHDDNGVFVSRLKMGEYYSYSTLQAWMKRISERMPDVVKLIDIGTTTEGRRIQGLKFGKEKPNKKIIVIDAGIHAREWSAIHTAMYFINLMVNGRDNDPLIEDYLENVIIYIFPVLNPDGYEYTRTDKTNPRARMWRKSRSSKACAFDGVQDACCMGVDLNRNFGFRFAEIGASRYPCSEIYHGSSAFSQPETRAFADFLTSIRENLEAYITLHAYSQLWIYSYSHRKFTYAPDIDDTRRIAAKAVAELGRMYGTRYRHGTGPEIIYAFSGGSTDWAKETLKTKYSYTIELRPTYEEWNGFVLEKDQLIPTAKETWAGVQVVINEVMNQWKHAKVKEIELNRIRKERCVDRLSGCSGWLRSTPNICRSSAQTMVRDCAKTCNLCHMIAV